MGNVEDIDSVNSQQILCFGGIDTLQRLREGETRGHLGATELHFDSVTSLTELDRRVEQEGPDVVVAKIDASFETPQELRRCLEASSSSCPAIFLAEPDYLDEVVDTCRPRDAYVVDCANRSAVATMLADRLEQSRKASRPEEPRDDTEEAIVHHALRRNIPAPFYVFDSNLRLLYFNEPAEEFNEKLHDRPLRRGLEPDAWMADSAREAFESEARQTFDGEPVVVHRHLEEFDNRFDWRAFHYQPVREESGDIVAGSLSIIDRTAERRTRHRLRRSQQRLWTFFEAVPVGIQLVDADGKIIRTNDAFREFTGLSEETLRGRHIAELAHFQDRRSITENFDELASGETDYCHMEARFGFDDAEQEVDDGSLTDATETAPDDELRWGELVGLAIRHPYEEFRNDYMVMVVDVTRRHELLSQLHQSKKMQALGELAGGVAHDFNNLLGIVNTYAHTAANMATEGSDVQPHLERIVEAAERGSRLTRQLLTFSASNLSTVEQVDINQLIHGLQDLLSRLVENGITLEMDLDDIPGTVIADPSHIEQIVMNLVVNARDAMPDGGEVLVQTRQVDVSEDAASGRELEPGTYTVLKVEDNGCGMDEETRRRIFEPFFSTKDKEGGSVGLGLATVYGIVQQLDGDIQVESEPGVGTTFDVYLPLDCEDIFGGNEFGDGTDIYEEPTSTPDAPEESAEPPSSDVADETPDATASEAASKTVLLVEDESDLRDSLRMYLEGMDFEVLEAEDGSEALETSKEHDGEIDLLMTDVIMPGIGGVALAEKIAERHPDANILLMSGYPGDFLDARQVADQQWKFIGKPFDLDELESTLHELSTPDLEPA